MSASASCYSCQKGRKKGQNPGAEQWVADFEPRDTKSGRKMAKGMHKRDRTQTLWPGPSHVLSRVVTCSLIGSFCVQEGFLMFSTLVTVFFFSLLLFPLK